MIRNMMIINSIHVILQLALAFFPFPTTSDLMTLKMREKYFCRIPCLLMPGINNIKFIRKNVISKLSNRLPTQAKAIKVPITIRKYVFGLSAFSEYIVSFRLMKCTLALCKRIHIFSYCCSCLTVHFAVTIFGPIIGTKKSIKLIARPSNENVVRMEGSKYHINPNTKDVNPSKMAG